MKSFFKVTISLLMVWGLVGCGESSTSTGTSGGSELEVKTLSSKLINQKRALEIDFAVESTYQKGVEVNLTGLDVDVTPCNVLKSTFIDIEDGKVVNTIVLDDQISKKTVHATVEFTEECTPTSYLFKANSQLSLNGKSNNVKFSSATQTLEAVAGVSNVNSESAENTNSENGNEEDIILPTYRFFNTPKDINITKANEEYRFKIQLIDDNGQVVSGQTVFISSYNISYGELSSYKAVTDANGFATFTFTSAKSLDGLTSLELFVHNTGGRSNIDSTIKLLFNKVPDAMEGKVYQFKNANPLLIEFASIQKDITINLVDSTGVGVSGKELRITTLDSKYGSITLSTAVTNGAGLATFSYVAPSNIDAVDGTSSSVTIYYTEDGETIREVIEIEFKKKSSTSTINYTFANVPTDVEVIKDGQEVFFEVQLINENQEAVSGKTLSVLSYDTKYGLIDDMSEETDANGFAHFSLTAPDSIDDINGTSLPLTIVYRDGTAVLEAHVDVKFEKINTLGLYQFTNVPTDVEVIKDGQKVFFEVQLIDENQEAVSGKTLSVLSYDTKYGRMENMSVNTDANGFAQFALTAPDSIDDINGTSLPLTIVYRDGTAVLEAHVDVKFEKEDTLALYQFKNVPLLSVEYASKSEEVSINLVDSNNVGVSGKTLTITTLDSKYGSISSASAVTNEAGVATFTYTSPSDIETIDGDSTSVMVRFSEDDFVIEQAIVISFNYSSNNNQETSVLPMVVIPDELETIELTSNSKSLEMAIQVFKDIAPYTEGLVKVELPSKVLDGVDVGLFEAYEVPVNSQGIATFNYTGPSNLKALMDNNDTESIFKFYHNENTAVENRQSIKVVYNLDEDSYTPIDYVLNVTSEDNDFSMGIPEKQKTFSILLKNANGDIVDNSDVNITKIEVITENSLVAKILDTDATPVNNLVLKNENNSPFTLQSDTLSGIVPLNVNIEFIDINEELKTLSTIVNVRVMSGPPSAISVSYVSTIQDVDRAKYEEKFAISVTDEYGNKVNTKPFISVGAIVGYAVDGSEASETETSLSKRLFYGLSDVENGDANGEILSLGDDTANTTNFEDNTAARSDVFQWVNSEGTNSDKLVVFGKGKNYEAMGKWDFSKIDNKTLKLEDDYFGIDRADLSYAIGHNYYQDQCLDDGREWLGSTDSETYQLDDEGTALVSYKYDYHLTGKDALVWVNLNGYQADTAKNTRIGEVTKHTLRGKGLESRPSGGYFVDKNTSAIVSFDIHHVNAPEWYRNGHFGYEIPTNKCASIRVVDSINNHDARSCNNGGVAYITFEVNATEDASCNFNINNILVSGEF